MMPASTQQNGMCMCPGPIDVCKTPAAPSPIPLPYPNIAMCNMATGTSFKVLVDNMPAIKRDSKIPMSNGDNPGVLGGVVSNMFMGECNFKLASNKVKVEGQGWVYVTCMTGQNGSNANCVGMQTVPSQVKVLVMP